MDKIIRDETILTFAKMSTKVIFTAEGSHLIVLHCTKLTSNMITSARYGFTILCCTHIPQQTAVNDVIWWWIGFPLVASSTHLWQHPWFFTSCDSVAGIVFTLWVCLHVLLYHKQPQRQFSYTLAGFCLPAYFCQDNTITSALEQVTRLFEIKMKVTFKDGCGPTGSTNHSVSLTWVRTSGWQAYRLVWFHCNMM